MTKPEMNCDTLNERLMAQNSLLAKEIARLKAKNTHQENVIIKYKGILKHEEIDAFDYDNDGNPEEWVSLDEE